VWGWAVWGLDLGCGLCESDFGVVEGDDALRPDANDDLHVAAGQTANDCLGLFGREVFLKNGDAFDGGVGVIQFHPAVNEDTFVGRFLRINQDSYAGVALHILGFAGKLPSALRIPECIQTRCPSELLDTQGF